MSLERVASVASGFKLGLVIAVTLALQLTLMTVVALVAAALLLRVARGVPLEMLLIGVLVLSALAAGFWALRLLRGQLISFPAGLLLGTALLLGGWHPVGWWLILPILWCVTTAVIGRARGRYALPTGFAREPMSAADGPAPAAFGAVRPRHKRSQVVGMAALLEQIQSVGQLIARGDNGRRSNGLLLHGEPGNGKTMYAHVLADTLKLPIIEVKLDQLKSRWINQTAEQIGELFDNAHRQAPCVLLLDEATSLLQDRSAADGYTHAEDRKATDAFLQRLDQAHDSRVVVVAACNAISQLDSAAIRPGRFDHRVFVPNPDAAARAGLLHAAAVEAHMAIDEAAVASVNALWSGFSVALVKELARKAERAAAAAGASRIEAQHLETALREQQGGETELRADAPSLEQLVQVEAVRQALADLADDLRGWQKIAARGGRLERGAVFTGPPGTGKTLAAQALAKSIGWNFVQTTGPALLEPGAADAMFAKAARLRPAIVVIDEAEAAIGQRGARTYADAVTAQLLSLLDGAAQRSVGLFVIACTNFPEQLDTAVTRPGRLGRTIAFGVADVAAAAAVVQRWAAQLKVELANPAVGETLAGSTFAEIAQRLERAHRKAIRTSAAGATIVLSAADLA